MKVYFAKLAVIVDDDLCELDIFDLIHILSSKVNIDAEYVEKEFGVTIRPLYNSLLDSTDTLTLQEIDNIKLLLKKNAKQ